MQHRHKPYEGLFITIEGGEGCGKSTLAKNLVGALQEMGYVVFSTREPGGSQLSEHIRSLLLNPPSGLKIGDKSELFLFLSARLQHIEEEILPHLRAKEIVICERFHDSTIAYQGCARHLGISYVEKLCSLACEGFEADVTLLLDLDPEIGLSRVKEKRKQPLDRMECEHIQFHKEVRAGYLQLADQYPNRIVVLDASFPSDAVVKNALSALKPHLMLKPV